MAPVVVEAMLKDPARLELGGEEKVLTVLFSDLQGFTSYSERYTPQQMIELLSEYYARMTERIFASEGTLKEYVGDELMAIFGAPVEQADHARRACAAALDMKRASRGHVARVGGPRSAAAARAHRHQLGPDAGRQHRLATTASPTACSATTSISDRVSKGSTRSTAPRS